MPPHTRRTAPTLTQGLADVPSRFQEEAMREVLILRQVRAGTATLALGAGPAQHGHVRLFNSDAIASPHARDMALRATDPDPQAPHRF